MTHDDRTIWSIALAEYGPQPLELKVLGYLSALLESKQAQKLPRHISAGGLAQLVGLLLTNITTGERPLLGPLRTMNRDHFQVLRHLQGRLTLLLLSDLPASLIPAHLRRLRAQLDFGM